MIRTAKTSRRLLTLTACAAAIGIVVACSPSGPPEPSGDYGPYSEPPYIGPRSPCSSGPAHAWDATFSEGPRESPHPVCIERCGTHPRMLWGDRGGIAPTIDAVPSGACAYEGEACSMVAVRPCCGPEGDHGEALLFECRCRGGAWTCAAAHHGGMCSCTDGGASGTDGGGGVEAGSDAEPADFGADGG